MIGCHWGCGQSDPRELRPYGPGGAPVCVPCTFDKAHPEREQIAKASFGVQLQASVALSDIGLPAIGLPSGPVPVMRSDLDNDEVQP